MASIRQPIVSVLGHVDHGKTTLLDRIRGTGVAGREAGGITQHIGATEVPLAAILEMCGDLVQGRSFQIPGLRFIDTPGHVAFSTLRARGGALADLAVLVIDVNEGFRPQTIESLNILRRYKTPFVVAANKIDMVPGWRKHEGQPFVRSNQDQPESTREELDRRMYELVGRLFEHGFSADRYDRIEDFTTNLAVIPVSAKFGEGIPDLLLTLIGLAQRFLEEQLATAEGPAVGTILQVEEEKGLGINLEGIPGPHRDAGRRDPRESGRDRVPRGARVRMQASVDPDQVRPARTGLAPRRHGRRDGEESVEPRDPRLQPGDSAGREDRPPRPSGPEAARERRDLSSHRRLSGLARRAETAVGRGGPQGDRVPRETAFPRRARVPDLEARNLWRPRPGRSNPPGGIDHAGGWPASRPHQDDPERGENPRRGEPGTGSRDLGGRHHDRAADQRRGAPGRGPPGSGCPRTSGAGGPDPRRALGAR